MKKTQIIDFFRLIQKTRVSFFSIMTFIMLGLTFYAGLPWAHDKITEGTNAAYRNAGYQTQQVIYPLGLSDEQIENLKSIDGVDDAEGFNYVYRFLKLGDKNYQAVVYQLTERINRPMNVEGTLPLASDEIAVLSSWAKDHGISIGDTVMLEDSEYNVTALMESPEYLCTNESSFRSCPSNGLNINTILFLSKEALNPLAFSGYTAAAIYSEELSEMDCFSESYLEKSADLAERILSEVTQWNDNELAAINGQDEITPSVLERTDGGAYTTMDNALTMMMDVHNILSSVFLIVGVLVAYSAVSRMVSDTVIQIGTKKAMGFYRREIASSYLLYVVFAAVLGGLIAFLLSFFLVEPASAKVVSSAFLIAETGYVVNLPDIILPLLAETAALVAVVLLVCLKYLKKPTILLLNGSDENSSVPKGFENRPLLRKLSLLNQVVILNLMKDKKRVFGMLVGIGGCAMMLTAGLSSYINLREGLIRQFNDYYHFDNIVVFDGENDSASNRIHDVLENNDINSALIRYERVVLKDPAGKNSAVYLFVPMDNADLNELITFRNNAETINYDGGVWIGEYYQKSFDIEPGDSMDLKTLNGKEVSTPVSSFYCNHLAPSNIYMDPVSYKDTFGIEAVPNAYMLSSSADMEKLEPKFNAISGYICSFDFNQLSHNTFQTVFAVAGLLSGVFVLMAVILEFMVLVNLLNVYIAEKKRELITMIINGYSRKEAKSYIYQDTALIAFIGIILGTIAGCLVGDNILISIEADYFRMIHTICWTGVLASTGVTILLTVIITILALKRVDSFKLSDINS